MKKAFLLMVACAFAFVSAQAQSSEVEAFTQSTKAQQFKDKNSFIKETKIYKYATSPTVLYPHCLSMSANIFTDLKSGEQVAALEFGCTITGFIGYLDMDQVDDLVLALETISNEFNNSDKKDNYTISYTAPGGIDVFSTHKDVIFRKKWIVTNEFGIQTDQYGTSLAIIPAKTIEKVISSIKEAQTIAKQSLGQ